MKICIITASLNHGGASVVAQDVASGMAQKGHDVLFVCSGKKSKNYVQNGYRIKVLSNIWKNPIYHYANPLLMAKLFCLLHKFKPDILHIHNINLQTFSLGTLLLSLKYPTIWTLHDLWPICITGWSNPPDCDQLSKNCYNCPTWPAPVVRLNRFLKETVSRLSKISVVCPSKWMNEMLQNSKLKYKPVYIVYNGIDKNLFHFFAGKDQSLKLKSSNNKKILLFCGGKKLAEQLPAERKGLEYLISALRLLWKKRDDIELLYIGDDFELPVDFSVPVHFEGRKKRKEMKEYYNRADLFIIPTLADNFPMTILEAMACKTPIISTNIGGIPEIIISNKTGILCSPRDALDLAEKIDYALSNPHHCTEMAERAYKRFNEMFTFDRMIDQYENVYIKTVADRQKAYQYFDPNT